MLWRIALFLFLFLALNFVPLQQNFLGGGMQRYLSNPWLWSWINFDGEHYLSLVKVGYQPLTYFYFPVFPMVTRFIGNILGDGEKALSGLLVSNISFVVGLVGFYKLILLDFDRKVAKAAIFLLLFFPTSFFFASYYTESLFFALVVWFFYFMRVKKWFMVVVLGSLASATRIIGATLLVPFGLMGYMYFLQQKTGDALAFMHDITIFGDQRSSKLILLPQVFYRYFVRIIPSLDYSYFPVVFSTFLEIFIAVLFLVLLIAGIKKIRSSYLIYGALAYLIPSLSGSFSSFPRYALVIFPVFITGAIYFLKLPKLLQIFIFAISFVGLGIATAFFTRGTWIA